MFMDKYVKDVGKIIFFVLGSVFLFIGIAGVLLPILPGIPFLIIAVLFFAAGMTRKKRKEFKKRINREKGKITREIKKDVNGVEKKLEKL